MAVFIRIDVDPEVSKDPELLKQLEEVCPVDIFKAAGSGLQIVDENVDECTLCELCLDVGRPGQVAVVKLYDGDATLERT
jgi:NAD-dependent dihydropyrimidine dehydrogenase PreA subunit